MRRPRLWGIPFGYCFPNGGSPCVFWSQSQRMGSCQHYAHFKTGRVPPIIFVSKKRLFDLISGCGDLAELYSALSTRTVNRRRGWHPPTPVGVTLIASRPTSTGTTKTAWIRHVLLTRGSGNSAKTPAHYAQGRCGGQRKSNLKSPAAAREA